MHRIFESLNYKGQPLTQADLLRNYLFMRLPHRGDEVYTHQWLPLQKLLSDAELEELAWLDLVLRGDDRATQESIYRSQQQRLGPLEERAIEQWIAELHHKARMFKRVLDPQTGSTPILRRALDRLNRWGSATTVHPICLHVMPARDIGQLTADAVLGEGQQLVRAIPDFLVFGQ